MELYDKSCACCAVLGASSWVWAFAAGGIWRSAVLGALPAASGPPKHEGLSQEVGQRHLDRLSLPSKTSAPPKENSESLQCQARRKSGAFPPAWSREEQAERGS
jgi:hypothetical protein